MELMQDEHVIYETKPGKGAAIFLIVIGIVTLFIFIGIAFIIGGIIVLKIRYILTNKRFIKKTPFSSDEVRLEKIESMNVTGAGARVLITGTGGHKIDVWGIKKGQDLVNLIHESMPKNSNSSSSLKSNSTDDLEKWHALMEKGVITKEEFENKKRKILDI